MSVLVTGSSGFIGYHLSKKLLSLGEKVIGIDNLNEYYDVNLKIARQENLEKFARANQISFTPIKADINDYKTLKNVFEKFKPSKVVNLAAQAGVRYSLENPSAYIQTNLVGFGNILELCKTFKIEHLVFASSSSVYGGNTKMPFNESDSVDHPVSLYAATKKSNELMAHSYSHLFGLPATGLRFFTVYGPWGRPDMALFLFTKAILNNEPIDINNNGYMQRDFTYIDDIVESLVRIIKKVPQVNNSFNTDEPDPSSSWAPFKIFNIGNSNPVELLSYIKAIEKETSCIAKKNFRPMQPGDVVATSSDTEKLESWIDFKPKTSISEGVKKFIIWYKSFYNS